jgi:hypothetical protein
LLQKYGGHEMADASRQKEIVSVPEAINEYCVGAAQEAARKRAFAIASRKPGACITTRP